ncbi:MAG: hypothetical protein K2L16_00685 [Muribaculaceae bacterium]|nr:hypothetical protein [Muribaculaceae bacterium]
MKIIIPEFRSVAIALCALAALPVAYGYETKTIDGVEMSIELQYCEPQAVREAFRSNPQFRTDFLVADGKLYFGVLNGGTFEQVCQLAEVVRTDGGWTSRDIDIDWGVLPKPEMTDHLLSSFPGNDSYGNPYVAFPSYTMKGQNIPMTIYALQFDTEGIHATARYEFECGANWCTRSPSVFGDVRSGNFSVSVIAWTHDYAGPNSQYPTPLVQWNVADGNPTGRTVDDYYYSYTASVQDLGEGYVLLDERGDDRVRASYDYINPTVVNPSTGYANELDVWGCRLADSGSRIFTAGGKSMIIYPYDVYYGETAYVISFLPEYPHTISKADTAWELTDGYTPSSGMNSSDKLFDNSKISVIPNGDSSNDIYILTRGNGLSHYKVGTNGGGSTGIIGASVGDAAPEYFTIDGRPAAGSAPGIYIVRRGSEVRKVVVR